MSILELGDKFIKSDGEYQFPVMENGTYPARVIGVEDVLSKKSSAPMWQITFSVEGEVGEWYSHEIKMWQMLPYGDGTEDLSDNRRNQYIDEIKKLWIATGADSKDGVVDSDELVGCQCNIVVVKEPHHQKPGKFTNKIVDTLPI